MSEKVEKARAEMRSTGLAYLGDINRQRYLKSEAAFESAVREEALEEALALATWPADYEAIRALKEKR